jgi:hypothetical protein
MRLLPPYLAPDRHDDESAVSPLAKVVTDFRDRYEAD